MTQKYWQDKHQEYLKTSWIDKQSIFARQILEYLREIIDGLFESVILDNKGTTYKDKIKILIRFVGRKI